MGGVDIQTAAMAMGGALGGRVITNALSNVKAIKSEQTKAYVRVALKGGIAYFLLNKPGDLQAAGFGLAAEAALDLAGVFAPDQFGAKGLAGVGTIIDLDTMSGVGYADMNTDYGVAGSEDFAVAGAY
jgi:hypothetical protein